MQSLRSYGQSGLCLLIGLVLWVMVPVAVVAGDRPDDDLLGRVAVELEGKGHWQLAAEAYWQLIRRSPMNPVLRQRYLQCLRRYRLHERHTDPIYRQHVGALPLGKSLDAYTEALTLVQTQYVDRVSVAVLFHLGLEEIQWAWNDNLFRRTYTPGVAAASWSSFLDDIRAEWAHFDPERIDEARSAVRSIALRAQRALGIKPSVSVMEFLCGACNGLDERSVFLTCGDEQMQQRAYLRSLGIVTGVASVDGWLVERVEAESWASRSGIKEADRIKVCCGMEPRDDVPARGDIEVQSPGMATARRLKLPPPPASVIDEEFHMGGVGLIRIVGFQPSTASEVERVVSRFQLMGLKALIIDLRGNPGGSIVAAFQLAERFLPAGTVVLSQGQNPSYNRAWESRSGMLAWDVPLVLLIDSETASAAEVFAGALKEHQRAKLIGTPTFGKGTVQHGWPVADQGTLRLTLARLFSPNGVPYEGTRVVPDIHEPLRPREVALELARSLMPWP